MLFLPYTDQISFEAKKILNYKYRKLPWPYYINTMHVITMFENILISHKSLLIIIVVNCNKIIKFLKKWKWSKIAYFRWYMSFWINSYLWIFYCFELDSLSPSLYSWDFAIYSCHLVSELVPWTSVVVMQRKSVYFQWFCICVRCWLGDGTNAKTIKKHRFPDKP